MSPERASRRLETAPFGEPALGPKRHPIRPEHATKGRGRQGGHGDRALSRARVVAEAPIRELLVPEGSGPRDGVFRREAAEAALEHELGRDGDRAYLDAALPAAVGALECEESIAPALEWWSVPGSPCTSISSREHATYSSEP